MHYEKFADGTIKCIEDEIPFDLPQGWEWCRLKSITEIITKGASPKWQGVDYTTTGTLFITSENVGNDTLLLEKPKFLNDKINEIQPRSILKKHDVLTNIVGASIGRTCEYTLDTLSNINQAVAIIRMVDICFSQYIVKCLNSKYCINLMFDNQVDMARANLSLSSLSDFLIPVPPIEEQHRIVKQLEILFVYIEEINISQKDIKEIVGLTKSKILDLAIRGKLVPQNPDDEPASVLLERIRSEKEELIMQGKIKRDKKESIIFKGDDNSYYEKYGEEIPQGWVVTNLETLLSYEQPTEYIVENTDYNDAYPMPVLTAGKSFILGYTNETTGIYKRIPTIIFDDFTTESKYVDFEFKVKSSAMKILSPNTDLVLNRFAYYLMQSVQIDHDNHQRYWISVFSKQEVALPPLAEQQRIVDVIDHLYSLLDNAII